MSEMVRKQIYIQKRQQALLRRLAQARGVSEAEIVRQAIEREAEGRSPKAEPYDATAWEEILAFIASRSQEPHDNEPYHWQREDAYDVREASLGAR